jgi:hypothetical protein
MACRIVPGKHTMGEVLAFGKWSDVCAREQNGGLAVFTH